MKVSFFLLSNNNYVKLFYVLKKNRYFYNIFHIFNLFTM